MSRTCHTIITQKVAVSHHKQRRVKEKNIRKIVQLEVLEDFFCILFKVESERLQRVIESQKDRYARTLNLQAQMDERELRQVFEDRQAFLKTAVEYYIKTLQTGVTLIRRL